MAYTTINKHTDYFNTKLFTGNGSTQSITGVGFQPDWVWFKNRSSSQNHRLFDAVRGAGKNLKSNGTTAEIDAGTGTSGQLRSFDSDGFSVGSDNSVNKNSENIVAWNWKAGTTSSISGGTITPTGVSINTTAGFGIYEYTGTNSTGTIAHGLGATPKVVIYKNRTDVTNWYFTTTVIDGTHDLLFLNTTEQQQTFSAPVPTSTVLNLIANNDTNGSGDNIIAYAFAEKKGYSKFGKFQSNGSDDGTFVFTGFAPKLIIMKPLVSDSWSHWYMFDNVRDSNLNDLPLYSNLDTQEAYYGGSPASNYAQIDILSNGFKIRRDGNWGGGDASTSQIYMAWGQSLVGSNNVPCTAR
tara:strand:+ start:24 stop:1082 length:1059 start_codon:yes stop_codon:yes gene_type:complete